MPPPRPSFNIGNVSLQQMRMFMAVLDTGQVSAAAASCNLTSSAVSHALARLRGAVGDELFIRSSGRLEPTQRAREIGERLRPLLAQLALALEPIEFDPRSAHRHFKLIASPHATATLLPGVIQLAHEEAPNIHFSISTALHCDATAELASGRADLALGIPEPKDDRLDWERLFADDLAWIARSDHPTLHSPVTPAIIQDVLLVDVATLRPYQEEPAAVSPEQSFVPTGQIWAHLAKLGYQCTVGVTVPDTISSLAIVASTDMVALLPRSYVQRLAGIAVRTMAVPVDLPKLICGMCWRKNRVTDPALFWALDLARRAAARLKGSSV
jgi:DNA-binding transcriptional LysR family regulator